MKGKVIVDTPELHSESEIRYGWRMELNPGDKLDLEVTSHGNYNLLLLSNGFWVPVRAEGEWHIAPGLTGKRPHPSRRRRILRWLGQTAALLVLRRVLRHH